MAMEYPEPPQITGYFLRGALRQRIAVMERPPIQFGAFHACDGEQMVAAPTQGFVRQASMLPGLLSVAPSALRAPRRETGPVDLQGTTRIGRGGRVARGK